MQDARAKVFHRDAAEKNAAEGHWTSYQSVPIKAKIHGAELIAREKITINWDDVNFDNYFYTDDDESWEPTGSTKPPNSTLRAATAPKYTVIYSLGTDIKKARTPPAHSNFNAPEVDLQKRRSSTEPILSAPIPLAPAPVPAQAPAPVLMHDSGQTSRPAAPCSSPHRPPQNIATPRNSILVNDDHPSDANVQKARVQQPKSLNLQLTDDVVDRLSANKPPDAPFELVPHSESPSRSQQKPLHISRDPRPNSSCSEAPIATSPSRQKKPPVNPLAPQHSMLSQRGTIHTTQSSPLEIIQPHTSANPTQQRQPQMVSKAPSHTLQPSMTVSQQSYVPSSPFMQGQGSTLVPTLNSDRRSIPTPGPDNNSPQRAFSRDRRTGSQAGPLSSNTRSKIPQPYQPPPQPVPQQYPTTGTVYTHSEEQQRFHTTAEQNASWRYALGPTVNPNAHQLQDAVRQADALHSHVLKQPHLRRPAADNSYSERLAMAEAILSPKRSLNPTHGGACPHPTGLSPRADAVRRTTVTQITDINNRLKDAMATARNSVTEQPSDANAWTTTATFARVASPTSRAGKRTFPQTAEGLSPSLQLTRKYADIAGITKLTHERVSSPQRQDNIGIASGMFLQRVAEDSVQRPAAQSYTTYRATNIQTNIDEMETAKHMASRISLQREGKRVPASTQGLLIKAASPSRGRQ